MPFWLFKNDLKKINTLARRKIDKLLLSKIGQLIIAIPLSIYTIVCIWIPFFTNEQGSLYINHLFGMTAVGVLIIAFRLTNYTLTRFTLINAFFMLLLSVWIIASPSHKKTSSHHEQFAEFKAIGVTETEGDIISLSNDFIALHTRDDSILIIPCSKFNYIRVSPKKE